MNAEMIRKLEEQLRTATDALNSAAEQWQTQASEERTATEARIKEIEEAVTSITAQLEERKRTSLPGSEPGATDGKSFSLAKACGAIMRRSWDGAEFEKEVFDNMRQRDMSSGVDGSGGFIVPDEAIPQVIERLKNEIVSFRLGARELPATGSPITIPRVGGSATAVWMSGENATIAASDLTLEQITMTPKTLGARVILSNQLMELSMPSADSMIENDIASQLAIGADTGILLGSGGTGEPQGIITDADVLTSAISDPVEYTELVDMVDALAQANSLRGRLGWAMHPGLYAQVMKVKSITDGGSAGSPVLEVTRHAVTESAPDSILGYPFATTNSFTASSDANSVIFGNWDDVLVAMWGGLRLASSTEANEAFERDQTHIRAIMRMDSALRHPQSFVRAT